MRVERRSVLRYLPWSDWRIATLLLVALAFGGGGPSRGILNLVVQAVALALVLFDWAGMRSRIGSLGWPLKALALATLALPLSQLIPLPPSLWHGLPGRDLVFQSLSILGAEQEWFPLSVDRGRTVAAVFALVTPLTAILLYRPDHRNASQKALELIVFLGLVQFTIGSLQLLVGGTALNLYPVVEQGRLYGLIANHNTVGLFFVVCLCSLIGLTSDMTSRSLRLGAAIAIGLLFVIGTLLTNSRSATVLLAVPLALVLWRIFLAQGTAGLARRWKTGLAVTGGLGLLVAAMALVQTRIGRTWDRFDSLKDTRTGIWEDALSASERYWPIGSGLGTFDEVFQIEESLETLVPAFARHAHNDYLEVLVEAGLFGALVVVCWGLLLAMSWWLKGRSESFLVANSVGAAILSIALQSFVDYPLRSQAMFCVAALLVAILASHKNTQRGRAVAKTV
ncbi:O-antigen ligase family protein [Qipengyuania zhejiangensis]|uniref:O-antigen ligase family protein n=1 Tax=Qipengyuania zhejiangensis TaxID=3077782 RepID=UPI002D768CF8|nr:O-antigen ligase family protein [Qipengyuania sp. Z2]